MKNRIYSFVFLISLFTGLLQPVLPLLEYYSFRERIIDLFCVNKDVPEMECDGFCYLKGQIEQQQQDARTPVSLLNLDDIPLLNIPVTAEPLQLFPDRITEQSAHPPLPEYQVVHGIFHPPQA
ncbi:MAG: hypothetical protein ACNA8K_11710 [Cyclonatronaceae bacterium]